MPERSGALVIRSREIESLSSPHLPAIELSFENHANSWQKIEGVRIYAANPAHSGPVAIVPDESLRDWRISMLQQKKVRDHKRDTAVGSVQVRRAAATWRARDFAGEGPRSCA